MRLPVNFATRLVVSMFECHSALAKALRVVLYSAAIFPFMVWGCCKSFDSSTKQENEEARTWVTGSWTGKYDWTSIGQWSSVSESRMLQAKMLLQMTSSARITPEQARDLTGESGFDDVKGTPYLLRAVVDANGNFPVDPSSRPNGDVWVSGGANSKCTVPMRRRPVVAWLNKAPEKVYVTFYVNHD